MSAKKTPQNIAPNHVALLLPSVRKAADYLRQFDLQIGPEEVFAGEGTKEIYVEYGKQNSLLLLEAIGPGPYQNALNKRGPGVHHLAIDVMNVEEFLAGLPKDGWKVHEISAKTIKRSRTAWLYYAGFPGLIEVQEREKLNLSEPFLEKVFLTAPTSSMGKLIQQIGLGDVIEFGAMEVSFTFAGKKSVHLRDLL